MTSTAVSPVTAGWVRVVVYGVVPGLALVLTLVAAGLSWRAGEDRDMPRAAAESVRAATDGTIAILSYRPDTVANDLDGAQDRLGGSFKDSYIKLTHDVVIPGSRQQQISAVATVPAAAPVTASDRHAVVLLFVDQTVTKGGDPPTSTTSRVRVTLDKAGQRWLITGFDPI